MSADFLAQLFPLLALTALAFLILLAWLVWVLSRRARDKRRDDADGRFEQASDEGGTLDRLDSPPPLTPRADSAPTASRRLSVISSPPARSPS